MQIEFNQQVVLVTGGTRGIGQKLVSDFAQTAELVLATGTHPEIVEKLNKESDPNVQYLVGDFTHKAGIHAFLKELKAFPIIDVCVNNAGINRINPVDETKEQDWDDLISVNLTAPLLITKEISQKMKKNGYGRIINIGSIFGQVSRAERTPYTASKYGVRGLTVTSSIELASQNILVNTLAPGFIETELTEKVLGREEMTRLSQMVPAQRLGTTQDISNVALFLASRQNTYLTGQNIIVDGGFTNV